MFAHIKTNILHLYCTFQDPVSMYAQNWWYDRDRFTDRVGVSVIEMRQ